MAASDLMRVEAGDARAIEYTPAGQESDVEEQRGLMADGATVSMAVPRSARMVPVVVFGALGLVAALYGAATVAARYSHTSSLQNGLSAMEEHEHEGSCLCNHKGLHEGGTSCKCNQHLDEESCDAEAWCHWHPHHMAQGYIEHGRHRQVLAVEGLAPGKSAVGDQLIFEHHREAHFEHKVWNFPKHGHTGIIQWAHEPDKCMAAVPCRCPHEQSYVEKNCRCMEIEECGDEENEDMLFEMPEGHGQIKWKRDPSLCLWMEENSRDDDELAILHDCYGAEVDSMFVAKPVSDFSYEHAELLKHLHGHCLASDEVYNDAPVRMESCDVKHSNHHIEWNYHEETETIENADGLCLDTSQGAMEDGRVTMWECHHRDHPDHENQRWVYDKESGEIKHHHGFCLHAPEHHAEGSKIVMMPCNKESKHQRWTIHSVRHAQSALAFEELTESLRELEEKEMPRDNSFSMILGDKHGVLFAASMGKGKASEPCEELRLHQSTRLLTSLAIGAAVAHTHLDWDDKVSAYLFWWTTDPDDWRSHITFRSLLGQTSGLGEHECEGHHAHNIEECAKAIYENGHHGTVKNILNHSLAHSSHPGEHNHEKPHLFWSDSPFIVAQAAAMEALGFTSWDRLFYHFVARHAGLEEEEGQAEPDNANCPVTAEEGLLDGEFLGHHDGSKGYDFIHPDRGFPDGATDGMMSAVAYGRVLAHAMENPEHYDLHEVLHPHEPKEESVKTHWLGKLMEKEMKHEEAYGHDPMVHAEYGLGVWVHLDEHYEHRWFHALGERGFLPAIMPVGGDGIREGVWAVIGRSHARDDSCEYKDYNTAAIFDRLRSAIHKAFREFEEMHIEPPHFRFEETCELKSGHELPSEPAHIADGTTAVTGLEGEHEEADLFEEASQEEEHEEEELFEQ